MHTRTTTAAALLATAGLLLTACSTATHHPGPHPTTTAATTGSNPATTTSEPPVPTGDQLATGARTTACWHAIRDQYTPGTVQLTGPPTTPPQCAALATDTLSDIAADVIQHQTDG